MKPGQMQPIEYMEKKPLVAKTASLLSSQMIIFPINYEENSDQP